MPFLPAYAVYLAGAAAITFLASACGSERKPKYPIQKFGPNHDKDESQAEVDRLAQDTYIALREVGIHDMAIDKGYFANGVPIFPGEKKNWKPGWATP